VYVVWDVEASNLVHQGTVSDCVESFAAVERIDNNERVGGKHCSYCVINRDECCSRDL